MVTTVVLGAQDSRGTLASEHPTRACRSAGIRRGERQSSELSVPWLTMTLNLIVANYNQSVKNSPAGAPGGPRGHG